MATNSFTVTCTMPDEQIREYADEYMFRGFRGSGPVTESLRREVLSTVRAHVIDLINCDGRIRVYLTVH